MDSKIQVCLLLISTFLVFFYYFYLFIQSIKIIISIFNKKQSGNGEIYWRLGINSLGSIILYLMIFLFYLTLKSYHIVNIDILDFIRTLNDKIFGFLFLALIGQTLSSLFNRQQFEYQKNRESSQSSADKIEKIATDLTRNISKRIAITQSLIERYDSSAIPSSEVPFNDSTRINYRYEKDIWNSWLLSVYVELDSLGLEKIIKDIEYIIQPSFSKAHISITNYQTKETEKYLRQAKIELKKLTDAESNNNPQRNILNLLLKEAQRRREQS